MTENVSTGITGLDRRLDGGLQPGSLLAVVAPPDSQSERLLHVLMGERPSLYLSTLRPAAAIEDHLDRANGGIDAVDVRYVGNHASMDNEFVAEMTGDRSYAMSLDDSRAPFDAVYEEIRTVDSQSNVIVDPATPLEESDRSGTYQTVLNQLKERALATDSVGVLHCIEHDRTPPLREMTLNVADAVWRFDLVSGSDGIEYRLRIPKNRSGAVIDEEIKILFGHEVSIDDSRTI
ncbi:RAD55 family ATPase [Halorhabdus amylolytica]|uniref:RAD55 family ATPase n=1 Tax=Halorhabdus amylolytica TaxID=2559573 RepID=UPI0010AA32BD|nr:hypothetical protein [Halorhabdus amylolytica]